MRISIVINAITPIGIHSQNLKAGFYQPHLGQNLAILLISLAHSGHFFKAIIFWGF